MESLREGHIPACGVVEVNPAGGDAWLTADTAQVIRCWNKHVLFRKQVLTDLRGQTMIL